MEVHQFGAQKILIIGCGGFVASHFLERLFEYDNIKVVGWDPDLDKIQHLVGRQHLILRDRKLEDDQSWIELEQDIHDADIVMNLAAICRPFEYNNNPVTVIRSNFIDCYRVVEMCAAQHKWLIHFSTSEVYGRTIASYLPDNSYDNPDLFELDENQTPLIMGPIRNQRWTYACSKQLLERYVFAHGSTYDMPFTIVRPLNFFGPRMDFIPGRDGEGVPRVLASFMTALLDGKPMQLVDGGHARRTITSIHDAVDAMLLMIAKPEMAKFQIFNIGNRDNEVTIAELAYRMRRIYADVSVNETYKNHPIETISGEEYYGAGYEDCDRRMPNCENTLKQLGWQPKTSLDAILRETIEYYYELYGGGSEHPIQPVESHLLTKEPK